MKNLLGLLTLAGLLLFANQNTYAGLPISERQEAKNAVVATKEIAKKSKTEKISWVRKIKNKIRAGREDLTLAVILTVLMPFLGIAVWQDAITKDFWITLLLTLLLYLPGLIYALSIIIHDSR